jgi:transcriptional regulator with XRE-family HTH domain
MARGERGLIIPDPVEEVGSRLRRLRLEAGVQQGDLASRSGVAQSTISKIEHGYRLPHQGTLLTLARALGLDDDATAELLRGGRL